MVLSRFLLLDGYDAARTAAEVCAAGFSDARTLVLLTSEETNDEEEDDEEDDDPLWRAGPRAIAYYDLITHKYRSIVQAEELVGKLMPIDQSAIVGFYKYPKLFDSATGKVIHRWSDLATGTQTSSIQWPAGIGSPVAVDVGNKQFAVAGTDTITVIEIIAD